MAKYTKGEVQLAQQIVGGRSFELLQSLAEELKLQWRSRSLVRESEWETVKQAIANEEMPRALDIFLKELENMSYGE